jgi:hypothetical protein
MTRSRGSREPHAPQYAAMSRLEDPVNRLCREMVR